MDRNPDATEEVFVNLAFLFQGVVVECGGLVLLCDFALDVIYDLVEIADRRLGVNTAKALTFFLVEIVSGSSSIRSSFEPTFIMLMRLGT